MHANDVVLVSDNAVGLKKHLSTKIEIIEVNTEKKTKYASLEGINVLIYSS